MQAEAELATRPSLTLKRHIDATPEQVYAAWTEPKALAKWFGPGPGPVTLAETDLRVGGRYAIAFMEDGEEHHISGTYLDVAPTEKLVFTWTWRHLPDQQSRVTVLIKPEGQGSLVTLIHEQFADAHIRDLHSKGWLGCLDELEAYFS